MNKETYGFNITTPVIKDWYNNSLEYSEEGIKDTLTDYLSPSYSDSDITKASESNDAIKKLLDLGISEKGIIVPINEKVSVLQFYTKNGRIISDFATELEKQSNNLITLNKAITRLTDAISKLEVNVDEIEVYDVINDKDLMPVFNSVSRLSFLNSIYIRYVQEKKAEKVRLDYDNKKIDIKKSSLILGFLKGYMISMGRITTSMTIISTSLKIALRIKIPTVTLLTAIGVTVSIYSIRSFKDGVEEAKRVSNENKAKLDKVYDIIDSAQIENDKFINLSKELHKNSVEMLETIKKFDKIDTEYKKSSNSVLRKTLRNTRILTAIALKVLNSQGTYYGNLVEQK